jgi:hypothetical protein
LNDGLSNAIQEFRRWLDLRIIAGGRLLPRICGMNSDSAGRDERHFGDGYDGGHCGAGAFYGVQGIPASWLEKLHLRAEILKMAEGLSEIAQSRRNELPPG